MSDRKWKLVGYRAIGGGRLMTASFVLALRVISTAPMARAEAAGVSNGTVVVAPRGSTIIAFKNELTKPMNVAIAVEPSASATCNVRANDTGEPLSVIAGSEGTALAMIEPGKAMTVQAVGTNGSCKWRITSASVAQ